MRTFIVIILASYCKFNPTFLNLPKSSFDWFSIAVVVAICMAWCEDYEKAFPYKK